ncbi:sensory neuron membrane protein 1-like [Uranotaenia lowii]|uniref:sensory neuron membrane protein 1-like n=1 Tax=Uranotaenia lowii TaxID=190385 RepID=UPI00247A75F1|nr:sensory neuron membrane protein 1-like [Uranotaenia lowii]
MILPDISDFLAKLEKLNIKKLGIIGVSTLIGGLLFSCGLFPFLIKTMIKKNMPLKPGSQIRGLYEKPPFAIDFKIYIFNVTNPRVVLRGGKPHVQEIGPLFFEEWKEKYDTADNEEEDTMAFNMRNTWIFRPDLSLPLTGNEMITIPHPIIMGALIMVQRDKEAMLQLVSEGLSLIFAPLREHAFLTVRVMDLLFDGIPIDCSSEEFSAKAICSGLDTEGAVLPLNDTHVKFSMFGMRNGTDAGRFVVRRGVKDIRDMGRMVSYNDELEMDVYDGDVCNQYQGTDSTIFPPLLTKNDKLWAWSPDICRSIGAEYGGKAKYAGMTMSYFSLDFGDLRTTPELQCYCRDPPEGCPPKGTMDMSFCTGAPLLGSKPHFLDCDPKLINGVDGLNPNVKDHDIYIYFDLLSGSPVSAAKRLQFSIEIEPIRGHEVLGELPTVVIPMFWAEEGVSLNKTWTNQLKYTLFLGLTINSTIMWLSIVIGTTGILTAGLVFYKKSSTKSTVNTVRPVTVESFRSGVSGSNGVDGMIKPNPNQNSISRDLVNINNSKNLSAILSELEKQPKTVQPIAKVQERY